jgi:hypothetical protein
MKKTHKHPWKREINHGNQTMSSTFQQNVELECKLWTNVLASQIFLITTTMYEDPTKRYNVKLPTMNLWSIET